jgi:hypothetical protein
MVNVKFKQNNQHQAHNQKGGCRAEPSSTKLKLKKNNCQYDIKHFTQLTLKPLNSATEIG